MEGFLLVLQLTWAGTKCTLIDLACLTDNLHIYRGEAMYILSFLPSLIHTYLLNIIHPPHINYLLLYNKSLQNLVG